MKHIGEIAPKEAGFLEFSFAGKDSPPSGLNKRKIIYFTV